MSLVDNPHRLQWLHFRAFFSCIVCLALKRLPLAIMRPGGTKGWVSEEGRREIRKRHERVTPKQRGGEWWWRKKGIQWVEEKEWMACCSTMKHDHILKWSLHNVELGPNSRSANLCYCIPSPIASTNALLIEYTLKIRLTSCPAQSSLIRKWLALSSFETESVS